MSGFVADALDVLINAALGGICIGLLIGVAVTPASLILGRPGEALFTMAIGWGAGFLGVALLRIFSILGER